MAPRCHARTDDGVGVYAAERQAQILHVRTVVRPCGGTRAGDRDGRHPGDRPPRPDRPGATGRAAPRARWCDAGRAVRLRTQRGHAGEPVRRREGPDRARPRSTSCPTAARSSSTPAPRPCGWPACCPPTASSPSSPTHCRSRRCWPLYPNITLHLLGGIVRGITLAAVGDWALRNIADVSVDVAFLGINGITVERGLTTPDLAEAQVKRALSPGGSAHRRAGRPQQVRPDRVRPGVGPRRGRHHHHRQRSRRGDRVRDRDHRPESGARMILTVTPNPERGPGAGRPGPRGR